MPRRRSNTNKYLLVAILLLVIVIVAAFAASRTGGQKPLASQYLAVAHTASTAYYPSTTSNTTIILTVLGLNITAVEGDATAVYVQCRSQAYPADDELASLAKGKMWDAPITLTGGELRFRGLQVSMNTQGKFEVDVTVSCNEARSATIPVSIDPKDIYITEEGEVPNP